MKTKTIALLLAVITGFTAIASAQVNLSTIARDISAEPARAEQITAEAVASAPERVEAIVAQLVRLFPEQAGQIVRGAMSGHPELTEEVVELIVRSAVIADPTQVNRIVRAATDAYPDYEGLIAVTARTAMGQVTRVRPRLSVGPTAFDATPPITVDATIVSPAR